MWPATNRVTKAQNLVREGLGPQGVGPRIVREPSHPTHVKRFDHATFPPRPFLCSLPVSEVGRQFSAISDGYRPGKTPSLGGDSRAIYSSHESPRSGVNVSGLRPSLITKHSLRSPCTLFTSARREGCFSVINDGRSPGKTPSLGGDSREINFSTRRSTWLNSQLNRAVARCKITS